MKQIYGTIKGLTKALVIHGTRKSSTAAEVHNLSVGIIAQNGCNTQEQKWAENKQKCAVVTAWKLQREGKICGLT